MCVLWGVEEGMGREGDAKKVTYLPLIISGSLTHNLFLVFYLAKEFIGGKDCWHPSFCSTFLRTPTRPSPYHLHVPLPSSLLLGCHYAEISSVSDWGWANPAETPAYFELPTYLAGYELASLHLGSLQCILVQITWRGGPPLCPEIAMVRGLAALGHAPTQSRIIVLPWEDKGERSLITNQKK